MTDLVTCRVCGAEAPLGTAECPECGAPLPTKVEAPTQPAPAAETPSPTATQPADEPANHAPAEKKPFKLRPVHVVAGLLALCLLIPMIMLVLPKKGSPPGAMATGNGSFVTPDGVWDYRAAGFGYAGATMDGRYFLLEKTGGADGVSTGTYRGTIITTSARSYAYAPTGEYYLFDGRVLERLEGENVTMTDNGVVFYTRGDDSGATLYRRDLNRGKTAKVDRFAGEGYLIDLRCAQDGSAAVYRWSETDEDGKVGDSGYRLWRQGTAKPLPLDIPGDVYGVGNGGKVCIVWGEQTDVADRLYNGYDYRSELRLWLDGELTALPENMTLMWENTACTQFLLREQGSDYYGDWYYYAPGETDAPVPLDGPSADYIVPASASPWFAIKSLKGCFYEAYSSGADKLYYLADDLTFLSVDEGVEDLCVNEAAKTALYRKDGDLYRAAVDSRGTLEVTPLTNTAEDRANAFSSEGTVSSFAASEDLKHIYYFVQDGSYSNEKVLHHWHNGVDKTLDFTINTNYGNVFRNVTDSGECYFTYIRNAYYTERDKTPQLLLEEVGTVAQPYLVGETKWPLLIGARWEGSQNKPVYWLLDGNKMPVELEEWEPEEGKV